MLRECRSGAGRLDMSKDDDSLEDINSLMNMIGGAKKKTPPPSGAEEEKNAKQTPAERPVSGIPDAGREGSGDLSALMKKLGMATKPGDVAPPAPIKPPSRQLPATPAPVPEESASEIGKSTRLNSSHRL